MDEFFYAKIEDLFRQSETGIVTASRFLDPQEQYHAKEYLCRMKKDPQRYSFFGGYEGAERAVLFCLPEWCTDASSVWEDVLRAVEIQGSGFVSLSHPQYLGSLLSLGIERETVGDIVLQDDHHAVVFVTASIADFLLGEENPLHRVASDTVRLMPFTVSKDFCADRNTEIVTDTVSSARLDCVVAALLRTSRAKAQQALKEKRVRLNFSLNQEPDCPIREGDQISIRGAGRFRILACTEKTRKDKLRLQAEHFIS